MHNQDSYISDIHNQSLVDKRVSESDLSSLVAVEHCLIVCIVKCWLQDGSMCLLYRAIWATIWTILTHLCHIVPTCQALTHFTLSCPFFWHTCRCFGQTQRPSTAFVLPFCVDVCGFLLRLRSLNTIKREIRVIFIHARHAHFGFLGNEQKKRNSLFFLCYNSKHITYFGIL